MCIKRVVISLTDYCNLKCKHCYTFSSHQYEWNRFLNKSFFEDLASLGVSNICFTGGEPTIFWENLEKILYLLQNFKFNILITTNGTLLSIDKLRELSKLKVNTIQISVDGYNEDIHDFLRGKGSFAKIENLLDGNIQKRFNVVPMYVLNSFNCSQVEKFLLFLISRGIKYVGFERFIPFGRGYINQYLIINKLQLKKAYTIIYNYEKKGKIKVHINDPIYNAYKFKQNNISFPILESLNRIEAGCSAYKRSIYISTNGDVKPCTFTSEVLFNLQEFSIIKIKDIFKKYWKAFESLGGKCKDCIYSKICGGCRAYAEFYYKNWLEEDPLCFVV